MKIYSNPDLKVIELNSSDIIATSGPTSVQGNVFQGDITGSTEAARAAGRRWDEWYEGY